MVALILQGHDGEDCAGDRGEVVGSDGGDPPFPHPPDASISFPGGRGVEGDMKIVEDFLWSSYPKLMRPDYDPVEGGILMTIIMK